MTKFGTILLILTLLGNVCEGQNELYYHSDFEKTMLNKNDASSFELFMAADPKIDATKYSAFLEDYRDLVSSLKKLKSRNTNDQVFLEKVFYKVHHRKLGWYQKTVTLSETLEHKKYDCLTGTALLALVLDDLGYSYHILEFDFHVFLIVTLSDMNILMEATDPFNGYVTDEKEIAKRINSNTENDDLDAHVHKTYIRNSIDLKALAGLQYFNIAVAYYNRHEYKKASDFIKKADLLYPSMRITNAKLLFATASL
jgi:hypothetical protein